jgi:hypothetical protein
MLGRSQYRLNWEASRDKSTDQPDQIAGLNRKLSSGAVEVCLLCLGGLIWASARQTSLAVNIEERRWVVAFVCGLEGRKIVVLVGKLRTEHVVYGQPCDILPMRKEHSCFDLTAQHKCHGRKRKCLSFTYAIKGTLRLPWDVPAPLRMSSPPGVLTLLDLTSKP